MKGNIEESGMWIIKHTKVLKVIVGKIITSDLYFLKPNFDNIIHRHHKRWCR
jgi:hypothetical protein